MTGWQDCAPWLGLLLLTAGPLELYRERARLVAWAGSRQRAFTIARLRRRLRKLHAEVDRRAWRQWEQERRELDAYYLAKAKAKQQRRKQRQRERERELGHRDWLIGLARWALTLLPRPQGEGGALRWWLADQVADSVQAAGWFADRDYRQYQAVQGKRDERNARARQREMRAQGQIVLLAGNDTIIAYSLRGASLAGVLPCSVASAKQHRKRYRSSFPRPVHREDQTDYWLAEELRAWWRESGLRAVRQAPAPTAQEISARFEQLDSRPLSSQSRGRGLPVPASPVLRTYAARGRPSRARPGRPADAHGRHRTTAAGRGAGAGQRSAPRSLPGPPVAGWSGCDHRERDTGGRPRLG